MKPVDHYIFSSNELFLHHDNTLPSSVPEVFLPSLKVRFPFDLPGASSGNESLREAAYLEDPPPLETGSWVPVRRIFGSEDPSLGRHASGAARGLGLVNWRRANRFCSRCGGEMSEHREETALVCPSCGSLVYPRLSPAIIVLVHREGKILLARHAQRSTGVWACIAGYLEHGESLEECVYREVREETGLRVSNIRYTGSQSWPFPDQFMIAFHADWESGEIQVDPRELAEAAWFSPDALPSIPPAGTVARRLIDEALSYGK